MTKIILGVAMAIAALVATATRAPANPFNDPTDPLLNVTVCAVVAECGDLEDCLDGCELKPPQDPVTCVRAGVGPNGSDTQTGAHVCVPIE